MEYITGLSISGIYALLIFGLFFSFLLATRVMKLQRKVVSYEESVDKRIDLLKERVENLEDSSK